jgi:hypothetical protein
VRACWQDRCALAWPCHCLLSFCTVCTAGQVDHSCVFWQAQHPTCTTLLSKLMTYQPTSTDVWEWCPTCLLKPTCLTTPHPNTFPATPHAVVHLLQALPLTSQDVMEARPPWMVGTPQLLTPDDTSPFYELAPIPPGEMQFAVDTPTFRSAAAAHGRGQLFPVVADGSSCTQGACWV